MRVFIFCADPREEANLEPKISQKLIKPGEKIVRLSLFGGPICLARPKELKREHDCVLGQLRFAVKRFGSKEIVLVGHRCGYYQSIPMVADGETQRNDLVRGANLLMGIFQNARVSAHYDISNGDDICFEEIVSDKALVS